MILREGQHLEEETHTGAAGLWPMVSTRGVPGGARAPATQQQHWWERVGCSQHLAGMSEQHLKTRPLAGTRAYLLQGCIKEWLKLEGI